jgi:hypothetical protein
MARRITTMPEAGVPASRSYDYDERDVGARGLGSLAWRVALA